MTDLDALLADPASVPIEQIPTVIGEIEKLKMILLARLTMGGTRSETQKQEPPSDKSEEGGSVFDST